MSRLAVKSFEAAGNRNMGDDAGDRAAGALAGSLPVLPRERGSDINTSVGLLWIGNGKASKHRYGNEKDLLARSVHALALLAKKTRGAPFRSARRCALL
jgi:hypothetical protein